MSSSRPDPGATIAARGQRRAAPPPAPPAPNGRALERFFAGLPGPLGRAPIAALLSWAGIFTISAVVLFAVAVRSADAIELLEQDDLAASDAGPSDTSPVTSASATAAPEPPKPPRASKAELDAARLTGADALTQLAQRFPSDASVLRELFLALATDKKSASGALRAARNLFEVAPEAGDDDDVRRALVQIANGPSDTGAVALDLIANEMGARGPELLFEIASSGALQAKLKAASLLNDPEVRKRATPALLIANDLRASLPCARKTLLARAGAEGDARSIPFLKPLVNTACGGFFRRGAECYRCFSPAERAQIQAIIQAIEGKDPKAAPSAEPAAAPDGG